MSARNINDLMEFAEEHPKVWANFMAWYEDPTYMSFNTCNRCGAAIVPIMKDYHDAYHKMMSLTIWLLLNNMHDILALPDKHD